jgi:D-alanyl-lipoteichoic acid acyltransferase DltB (MBOAT superfamily)
VEFWRRWHITLSTFLRDYVFIPLGGIGRPIRRYVALVATMLL